jgi:tRNA modification GTPase
MSAFFVADTIFARASGAGRAGVALFRISGPRAFAIAEALSGPLGPPRRVAARPVRDSRGDMIDAGLVILFKGPKSFTGEDVAEFHLHGSPAVEDAFYECLRAHSARLAEPGEFTRRALINGKIDLAEVEGLADLLDAETSSQRQQALGQLGGRLSSVAEGWRNRLVAILAPIETEIDFPDEGGIPASVAARAGPEIAGLIGELERTLGGASAGRAIREGVRVAIIGAPNAGKSSLLNRLAGSDRAIVSEAPGTTRDVLEARLDLNGILVSLFDTAGLRDDAVDPVEAEGMRRAALSARAANIRILMIDASDRSFHASSVSRGTCSAPAVGDERLMTGYGLLEKGDFVVFNKIDLFAGPARPAPAGMAAYQISAKTGEGIDAFVAALGEAVALVCRAEDGALTRARHVEAVKAALSCLHAAQGRLLADPELAAEDVRLAARALGGITGAVGVEAVLDAIFASFCIGK